MKLYARTYFTAEELNISEKIHLLLFTAIVIDQLTLSNQSEITKFVVELGAIEKAFTNIFNSKQVDEKVRQAVTKTKQYNLASVPEIIVNGKYKVDPRRAGGQENMFKIIDYLVNLERKR